MDIEEIKSELANRRRDNILINSIVQYLEHDIVINIYGDIWIVNGLENGDGYSLDDDEIIEMWDSL